MKGDVVFKGAYNELLDHFSASNGRLAENSEGEFAELLKVSRTTIRKALFELSRRRLLSRDRSGIHILRKPRKDDYFPIADTVATSARVEKKFMEWMLHGDRKPDQHINGLELAREFNVSASAIREYLSRFARFGLVEKRPNSGWIIRGFTAEFALELFEVRELFELRSAQAFAKQSPESSAWKALRDLQREHRGLLAQIDVRYRDFSDLDERFHHLINDAARNRFIASFHDVISLIFHYHYQWNKVDEKERNAVAIHEHLEYIKALISRKPERIELACRRHLKSARNTLLASLP